MELERPGLSRKEAQESQKFGNKLEAVNPPEVPLVQGGTIGVK
jgi:hypothetical protein